MPKTTDPLTAVSISSLSKPGLHADGAGLYLKVRSKGAKSWVFRFMRDGKPRYLGLGSAGTVKLAAARGLAGQARQQLQNGLDPIEARKQAVASARAKAAKSVLFKEFAESVIDAREAGWKNAKHRQQWRNTLKKHVYPKLEASPPSHPSRRITFSQFFSRSGQRRLKPLHACAVGSKQSSTQQPPSERDRARTQRVGGEISNICFQNNASSTAGIIERFPGPRYQLSCNGCAL